jgi:YVTN family beta-propeller protein
MSRRKLAVRTVAAAIVGVAILTGINGRRVAGASGAADDEPPFTSGTRSSPIAITSDDRYVWSVNPDNDSVSVFDVRNDANQKIAEIGVGREPWCVAITSDDRTAYVTNMESGTVSVIDARRLRVMKTIRVGAEPFGCALTADSQLLFVANQSSNTVSVINTEGNDVEETIRNVGEKPHGLAVSEDGSKLFVTQFLALKPANDPRPLTQSEGADDGREGESR